MAEADKRIAENEEQLRLAIESTQLGTWVWYPLTGDFTWSAESKKIFGLTEDAPLEFSFFEDHVYPEDRPAVTIAMNRALDPAGDGKYDCSYRIIRCDDNSIRWVHPKGKVFFNEQHQPERFIGTIIDVTEYRTFEENLRESEQRIQLAVEAANIGTFEWDMSDDYFSTSERLREIFGFAKNQEISHAEFIARLHPADKVARDRVMKDAIKNGGVLYEARILLPDDSVRWIRAHGRITRGSSGTFKKLFGIVMDITGQKNQEALLEKMVAEKTLSLLHSNDELRKSEERYAKMAEEVQDYAILLLSTEGFILNWNKGAERIKGYKESEILGKHFRNFYLPEDQASHLPEKLIAEAARTGRATHEGWRIRKDRSTFWASTVITALHDDRNKVIGFTKVTRDLTERKLAEDKMQQYTKELEAQNRELEQFAYIASHDLQEPLRKIQTFTEVMELHLSDPAQTRKYLDKINSSAQRMSQLIRSVLEYSKVSMSEFRMEAVDLNKVINSIKTDFELLLMEKQVKLEVGPLPVLPGMSLQLQQLFTNLISNAIKFSDKRPVIRLRARLLTPPETDGFPGLRNDINYTEITCIDNGIGFEQKYAAKIFTIFQRLHGQRAFPGTGIGLALCKKIVENHHGHLRVESTPGSGTSFFIYLPVEG